jgi:hypothetical protein
VFDDGMGAAQFTPPHSECSITVGKGITTNEPGSVQRLEPIVSDVEAGRGCRNRLRPHRTDHHAPRAPHAVPSRLEVYVPAAVSLPKTRAPLERRIQPALKALGLAG